MWQDTKLKLIDQLKVHEGFRSTAYKDTEGLLTIGIGRLIDEGGGITPEEAEFLLDNDIERCRAVLERNLHFYSKLSETRKIVLLDMYFNLGNRLFGFKKTLKFIEEGNFAKAAEEMLDSKWAGQVGERAQRLSEMMKNDESES
jgi:lysozyme